MILKENQVNFAPCNNYKRLNLLYQYPD